MIMKTSYQGLGCKSHQSKYCQDTGKLVYQSALRLYLYVAKQKKEK